MNFKIFSPPSVVLVIFFFFGCGGETKNQTKPPGRLPVVAVVEAKAGEINKTIDLTGSIEPTEIARIASPAEGPVVECSVREGDFVHGNQVIVTIGRNEAAEALLDALRKTVEREEEDARRVERLIGSGALPGEQMDISALRVAQAKAQLEKAIESISDYSIRAPWNGVVSKVYVRVGDFVSPRTVLAEIFDPASLHIRFAVPEKFAAAIHNGMPLSATLDAFEGRGFQATVTRVYPGLDEIMRTRTVEANIIEKAPLLPAMFVRLKINVEKVSSQVSVPLNAVLKTPEGKKFVYVIEDYKAIQRQIVTGAENDMYVEILDGIRAGDTIAVEGISALKDGITGQIAGQRGA